MSRAEASDALPEVVRHAYGLSSRVLMVDLRCLDANVEAELSAALGETRCSGPVVNITSLNDAGVKIPLLVQVLRQGLKSA